VIVEIKGFRVEDKYFIDGTLGGPECIGRSVNHDSCPHQKLT
jgi:hypothetical protein